VRRKSSGGRGGGRSGVEAGPMASRTRLTAWLTLVHFPAQPEPFLSPKPPSDPTYPTQSAYVEPSSGRVYTPGTLVHLSARPEPN